MEEIIAWLGQVETLASDVYTQASFLFREDKGFSEFLRRLAEDEKPHAEFIQELRDYVRVRGIHPVSEVRVDKSVIESVEGPLKHTYELAAAGSLGKEQMVYAMVDVEHSEWNHIFLYVVGSFARYAKEFQYMAAAIQAHKARIQEFIDGLDQSCKPTVDVSDLPTVWHDRFLVVDDDEDVLRIFSAILSRKAEVHTARDGREALDKTKQHFFNVIVSDIELPVMDGLKFYSQAVAQDPRIASCFLFCSGALTAERKVFLESKRLRYLEKPVGMRELVEAVWDVARRSAELM